MCGNFVQCRHYIPGERNMSEMLREKIARLKKERNAVILVHNYQPPEVQDIADILGDSLGLSQQAAKTDADVIVFCGVYFMAETAAILCPQKKVLIPDTGAGCPMADMIKPEGLAKIKAEHPNVPVVTYINSTAAIKAESDVCCTSANADKIIASMPEDKIIFIPDQYLGGYIARSSDKEIVLWPGYCPSHRKILIEDMADARKKYPGVPIMVHPECPPDIIDAADAVLSTEGMCRYAATGHGDVFLVGTEIGMVYRLQKMFPHKKFYPVSNLAVCPNMKKNSLEKVAWVLEDMSNQVIVDPAVADKARVSIERMLEYSRTD